MRSVSKLAVPLLLLASGCGGFIAGAAPGPASRRAQYFDVKGFLDQQVTLLTQRHPAVEKQVTLRDGQVETTRVEKIDWTKELQIFYQADINKPALRGAYETQDARAGDTIDAVKTYRRKPGVENSVEQLRVTQTDTRGGSVEAVLTQDNPLFFSRKVLQLHYQRGLLTSYQVQGVQKLVLFDTLRYSANVRVLQ
jgi:hypothetical protein